MSDENRARILRKALTLFVAHGYDGVGVQQLATAAGVQKPTLYHYFGSKAGLLRALLTEHLNPFYEALATVSVHERDAIAGLTAVARATFAFAQQEPELYRLLLALWFAPPKSEAYQLVRRFHERHYAVVEAVFVTLSKAHPGVRDRHRLHAAGFLGMLNNCVSLALNGYTKLDDKSLRLSVDEFLHGILAQ